MIMNKMVKNKKKRVSYFKMSMMLITCIGILLIIGMIISKEQVKIENKDTVPVSEMSQNHDIKTNETPDEKEKNNKSNIDNVDNVDNVDNIDNVDNVGNMVQNQNELLQDWKLLLVNKQNLLPNDFKVELKTLSSGHKVDKRAYEDLQEMMDDAREKGLKPLICSSYRTQETQTRLFNNEVKEYQKHGYSNKEAKEKASMWVAIPGTSEHQTGLALDIVSLNYQLLDKKQEETPEQKWLIENSYRYGFILRYPTNKSNITGIGYEPWHYRYVGREHAKIMKQKDMVLEEYIEYLKNNGR